MRRANLDARSDVALIEIARRGDLSAYEELVRRYQDIAFRVAFVITDDAADAEDVAQEAFIKAWRALDRFDPAHRRPKLLRRQPAQSNDEPAAFRPWLLTIVANEARNRQRTKARHPEVELEPIATLLPERSELDPETIAVDQAERDELVDVLNRLSDDDRAVITLRYFLDLSEAEMASALDIARGTVKSRLSRALQRARAQLESSRSPLAASEEETPRG